MRVDEEDPAGEDLVQPHYRFRSGGSFILDAAQHPEPLWGRGAEVLWAEGESLMIAGPQGSGKSTLGQQLALGRAGFPEYGELLGWPIRPDGRKVLYLAMDRPRQIARSLRRMVGEAWRDELDNSILVWEGPPPRDLAKHPSILLDMARAAQAGTVVVDSLKDAAVGIIDDEVGAGWNRARQSLIVAQVQLLELHHNRKQPAGPGSGQPSIDAVYGSVWLTAGAGSVILLTGAPGDPVVKLHHLKQPADPVGPLQIVHDHGAGRSSVFDQADIVAAAAVGITAQDAAQLLYDTEKPSPAQREKARRKLAELERQGRLVKVDAGDKTSNRAAVWRSS